MHFEETPSPELAGMCAERRIVLYILSLLFCLLTSLAWQITTKVIMEGLASAGEVQFCHALPFTWIVITI